MKNWFKRNLKNIIITSFIIPILLVAFVSISHVTTFYGITNPLSWSVYLSIAVEIAAISALAGISVRIGKFIYIPFGIVTIIQFIGNVFFSFNYIDESTDLFRSWMEMTGTLLEPIGIEPNDVATHKTILSLFSGGLLPLISLTFAHMLVKYTDSLEDTTTTETTPTPQDNQQEETIVEERPLIEDDGPVVMEKVITTQEANNIKRLNYLGRDQNVKDS